MQNNDAAWIITAVIGVAFVLGFAVTTSSFRWGYLILGLASFPLAYVRFKAARSGGRE